MFLSPLNKCCQIKGWVLQNMLHQWKFSLFNGITGGVNNCGWHHHLFRNLHNTLVIVHTSRQFATTDRAFDPFSSYSVCCYRLQDCTIHLSLSSLSGLLSLDAQYFIHLCYVGFGVILFLCFLTFPLTSLPTLSEGKSVAHVLTPPQT